MPTTSHWRITCNRCQLALTAADLKTGMTAVWDHFNANPRHTVRWERIDALEEPDEQDDHSSRAPT